MAVKKVWHDAWNCHNRLRIVCTSGKWYRWLLSHSILVAVVAYFEISKIVNLEIL